MNKWQNKQFVEWFIQEYQNGMSLADFNKKYGLHYSPMRRCLNRYNIPDNNTSRFSQKYEIIDDYAVIYVKKNNGYIKVMIDIEDIEKCKSIGIWSISNNGYIMNCKTKIYLHRFVMECPDDMEVDHIYHNLLDNRKKNLRLATSSDQKCNTHIRTDNKSGQRGVSWSEDRQKWCVFLKKGDIRITKRFDSYFDACDYADSMMDKLQKEFKYKEYRET